MMLEARHLSIRFGGLRAVQDVSFSVPQGQVSALIGPNGAGKSTLFGLMSGFLRPDTGSVLLAGRDITGMAPHAVCRLGMTRTFQIVQPFAGQTVRENIAVGAHLREPDRARALAAAEAVARRLGLEAELDKLASSLTIAGRKRLELARARNVAGKREYRGEERVERAVGRRGAFPGGHVGVAVPKFTAHVVGQIFLNGGDAGVPHLEALLVAEQEPAFPKIFVIGIDPAADVTIGIDPGAGLDVDAGTDEADRRAAFVSFDQSAFGLVVENGFAGQLTESAKLQEQRPGFGWIR